MMHMAVVLMFVVSKVMLRMAVVLMMAVIKAMLRMAVVLMMAFIKVMLRMAVVLMFVVSVHLLPAIDQHRHMGACDPALLAGIGSDRNSGKAKMIDLLQIIFLLFLRQELIKGGR